ncbi:MAG: hypothetical protein ACK4OE_15385 [Acidovorax sp.]|uniref:hypothetical protein n=1 Tax=Acidovorax sp. TaxID=1872122 RepID=UPI0039192A16
MDEEPLAKDEEAIAFADRLNALLDARRFDEKGKGRQVALAKKYGITQASTRKWLEGFGFPKTAQMMRIARDFDCTFEWLALGTGPRDTDPLSYSPHMELLQRMETASPETRKLIELALMSDSDLQATNLSPSLKGLVGFVKQQIREEGQRGGKPQ